jgi:hypothetical protein
MALAPDNRGLSPTERHVTGLTSTGVRLAKRAYLPTAVAQLVLGVAVSLVILSVLWHFIEGQPGGSDPSTRLGRDLIVIALVMLVVNTAFAVVRIDRKAKVFRSLPADGSIGPGEVRAHVYTATWRLETVCQVANILALLVFVGFAYRLVARVGVGDGGPQAGWLLIFPAAGIAYVVLLAMKWRSQGLAAKGLLTSASNARPTGRIGRLLSPAPVTVGSASPSEVIRCWAAPVLRVASGRASVLSASGWAGPNGIDHDMWAQNTVAVTDQAVYVLCVIPPEQTAVLASPSYWQVKIALFYSGTAVLREATTQLQGGIAAVASADPRNGRIPLSALTGMLVEGAKITLTSTLGPPDSYAFNHAETAAAFAAQAASFGLPVQGGAPSPASAPR